MAHKKKQPHVIVSTGYLVLATGRYFKVRTTEGSYDFLLNGKGTALDELNARQQEIQRTADQWQRQADLLAAAIAHTQGAGSITCPHGSRQQGQRCLGCEMAREVRS